MSNASPLTLAFAAVDGAMVQTQTRVCRVPLVASEESELHRTVVTRPNTDLLKPTNALELAQSTLRDGVAA